MTLFYQIEIHKKLWDNVKQQVEDLGLKLRIHTKLPQKNK